jgi:hypothetical protein
MNTNMRTLICLLLVLSAPACFGQVPALFLGRPLPNGCLVHAVLYMSGLDPVVGKAEMVKVVGGGGIGHVITVITTPDGRRYGRDEDLGVFALAGRSPQAAYDRARREAIASRRLSSGASDVGAGEQERSLRAAFERLSGAGLQPQRVNDVVVWRFGGCIYVYSPLRGSAEIRTCSTNLVRAAAAAVNYWARGGER